MESLVDACQGVQRQVFEPAGPVREDGLARQGGLECGLRFSAEIFGSRREKTVFREYLQDLCFSPTEISEHILKPPGVHGIILYTTCTVSLKTSNLFCGLDSGNLKFETVRTHKQRICF